MKSRDLSIYELYKALQIEYVVAELRRKIYPRKVDQEYYDRVMEFKRKAILDIALRNRLQTIFDKDSDICKEIYLAVYREKGLPNFVYKDEETKQKYGRFDKINYFSIGSEIRTHIKDKEIIGRLMEVDLHNMSAKLENGKIIDLNITTRIL